MTSGCYTDILSFFPQSCVKETIGRRQTLLLAPKNSSSAGTPSPPISARHRQQYVVQPVVRDRSLAARNRSTNRYSRKYPAWPPSFSHVHTSLRKVPCGREVPVSEFIDTSSIIIRRDNIIKHEKILYLFFFLVEKKKKVKSVKRISLYIIILIATTCSDERPRSQDDRDVGH